MTKPDESATSVVVVLDPSLVHRAPLRAAAWLASRHGLTLTALVLRNPDYSRLARLPFTRELRISSSAWSTLSEADIVRGYAGQLRRVERLLREVAAEFELHWRIEQTAVHRNKVLKKARRLGGLVLLDRSPLVPVDQRRRYRQVIAVCDAGMSGLVTAARLAEVQDVMLKVLVLSTDAEGFGNHRDQARQILGGDGRIQWRWQVISDKVAAARAQILGRLAHETAATQSLVVLPADSPVCPTEPELTSLRAATVVLVSAVVDGANANRPSVSDNPG